jgi:hypothetical protein
MNAGVLRVDALRPAPMWTPAQTFEPTDVLARGLRRAVSYVVGPVIHTIEDKDRSLARRCMAVASPIVEQIQRCSSPVLNGEVVVAEAASVLVRQEAMRLAVEFACEGLDATGDEDEVVAPSVHQAQTGAVQFEWHRKGIDLEITVQTSGEISGYVERDGAEPVELDLSAGLSPVLQELRAVSSR